MLTNYLALPFMIITLFVLIAGGMLGYIIGYGHGGDYVENLYRD